MNKKAWEKLSPMQRQVVQEVTSKYAAKSFNLAMEEDQKYRDMMASKGIKVIVPTDKQLKVIADKVRNTVWPAMDKVIGKDIMDIMRKNSGLK
jgi:TRAP-type C4-dicarboxylate transport system substrate-binding protein